MNLTTAPLPAAHRPGRSAWAMMTRMEARLVVRDTAGLIIPVGVPVLFMVMNGMGAGQEPLAEFGGMTALEAISVPATLVMILALFGTVTVPSFLATYRQGGVLRRLSATPARPLMVLVAQVVVNATLGAIGIAIAIGVAVGAFGVGAPGHLGGAILTMLLGALALYGTGLVVAAIAPTANAALAIGLSVFFVMMASGGGMLPAEALPGPIARVGELLPFGATLQALRDSWAGTAPSLLHLGVLVVTTGVSAVVAARVFRWD